MRIVVDSNEFVFSLTRPSGNPSSVALQVIAESAGAHVLLVSRFIVEEVSRHLSEADFKDFWSILLLAPGRHRSRAGRSRGKCMRSTSTRG